MFNQPHHILSTDQLTDPDYAISPSRFQRHGVPDASDPTVLPDGGVTSRDNYRGSNQNKKASHYKRDSEPADPDYINHGTRRDTKIGPPSVSVNDIPDPLVEIDGEDPRLPTVREAGNTYLAVQRSSWNSDDRESGYERHRYEVYPRILDADRQLVQRYDGLTTVMITRRLSPTDKDRGWIPPLEIDAQLHDTRVWRSFRRCLCRQLERYEFEYLSLTAPTTDAGTPHQHTYVHVDDPDDEITADDFAPALEKHLKHCPNASEEHHQYESDGSSGAITVQHQPETVRYDLDTYHKLNKLSATAEGGGILREHTAGAQYLASQLPHLELSNMYDASVDNPSRGLIEGAAVAWASPHNWLRTSSGFPTLDGGDTETDG